MIKLINKKLLLLAVGLLTSGCVGSSLEHKSHHEKYTCHKCYCQKHEKHHKCCHKQDNKKADKVHKCDKHMKKGYKAKKAK